MEQQDCDIQERNLAGNACLDERSANFCGWEYARKGDYHRNLDTNWSYCYKLSYFRKIQQHNRRFLSKHLYRRVICRYPSRFWQLPAFLEHFCYSSLGNIAPILASETKVKGVLID